MHLVHLTASTFFGGPERQMLGLAGALQRGGRLPSLPLFDEQAGKLAPRDYQSTYLSYSEGGRCTAFLDRVNAAGFAGIELRYDTPHVRGAIRELTAFLRDRHADVLIVHGYKSNLLGWIAARRVGIPIVAVSRGWTGENAKVRLYETLDRFHLRFMDAVVPVSEGQARKVRLAGVPAKKMTIIRNAARLDAFRSPLPEYREKLRMLVGGVREEPLPRPLPEAGRGGNALAPLSASRRGQGRGSSNKIILAAGRLSPEKGFAVLVEAAAEIRKAGGECRFVLFGDGVERPSLERRINELGLQEHFILAGFRDDLDCWLPWADIVVLPSFTEGLPNVALEASAAGIPVVATAVGGTPEVVRDGATGYLVPAGNPSALAGRILELCRDDEKRRSLGEAGRRLMQDEFSFEAQATAYRRLFARLVSVGTDRRVAA